MRLFTVQEAQALIPRLEEIFSRAAAVYTKAQDRARSVARLESSNADAAQLAIERAQLQFLADAIEKRLADIGELGALPKGLDPALVDFPCRIEDRDAYLCWRLGEKKITHYHGREEGFAGRKALYGIS